MIPLHHDPWFTFRFADDRIIPRFHLEGVESGKRVSVFKIDPGTGERLSLLATATVGEEGWVDLTEPIIVRAGEAFVAVPETEPHAVTTNPFRCCSDTLVHGRWQKRACPIGIVHRYRRKVRCFFVTGL
jgi:hypothetical protein